MGSPFKTAIMMTMLCMGGTTVGCATSPPLRTDKPPSGLCAAEEVGAAQARASWHLQLAQEELEIAGALVKNDESAKADLMLSRAEADAALAFALCRAKSEKAEAQEAMDHVRQLRVENQVVFKRSGKGNSHEDQSSIPSYHWR